MSKILRTSFLALACAGVVFAAGTDAEAQCVTKAGHGTGGSVDSAKFQAWEAVLQATDWGSWASFMASGGQARLRARLQGQQPQDEMRARRVGPGVRDAGQALQIGRAKPGFGLAPPKRDPTATTVAKAAPGYGCARVSLAYRRAPAAYLPGSLDLWR